MRTMPRFAMATAFACLTLISASDRATAADDGGFGAARFADQGHPALGPVDDVSGVEPAAGAEAFPVTGPPGAMEAALEGQFETDVTRSAMDRGGDEIITRDRVGDGQVGVFYDHTQDDRIQDSDDALGLDVELFEFR